MHLTYDLFCETHELYQRVVDHYGVPVWWDVEPELILYADPNEGYYGWHELNAIGINISYCEHWADIVGTVIHEYWHHMQDPERTDEEAYEAEAESVTTRDLSLFIHPLEA